MANPSLSPEVEILEREQLVPLYRVVLLDDNDHTYDYVIEMLQKIFIFTLDQAYRHAEAISRPAGSVEPSRIVPPGARRGVSSLSDVTSLGDRRRMLMS